MRGKDKTRQFCELSRYFVVVDLKARKKVLRGDCLPRCPRVGRRHKLSEARQGLSTDGTILESAFKVICIRSYPRHISKQEPEPHSLLTS